MAQRSTEFRDYVLDQLDMADRVGFARFFGGTGLRADGLQFAMIMGDTLYFCVDDDLRADLNDAGGEAFSYATKRRRVTVGRYVSVSEDLLEDPEGLQELAQRAIAAARR